MQSSSKFFIYGTFSKNARSLRRRDEESQKSETDTWDTCQFLTLYLLTFREKQPAYANHYVSDICDEPLRPGKFP